MDLKIVGCQSYQWTSPIPAHRRTHGGILAVTAGAGQIGVGIGVTEGPGSPPDSGFSEGPAGSPPVKPGATLFDVAPGDIVIYLPYEDHSYHPMGGDALEATMVRFEFRGGSQLAEEIEQLGAQRHFRDRPALLAAVEFIESQIADTGEFALRSAESTAAAVLYAALSFCAERPAHTRESAIDTAMERFYRDYSSRLSDVAADLGISAETIRREFKRHFGHSPMQYFTEFRISRLAYRLQTSDAPLHELAEEFGFCDEFHLSRVFKRHTGIPPGEYRKSFSQ